jgi:hypothetical protein
MSDRRRGRQRSGEQDSGQNGQSGQIELRSHPSSFCVVENSPRSGVIV